MIRAEGAEARQYFEAAAEVAQQATCRRAKCGSVIIKNDVIIGRGYNAPALDDESQRTCEEAWDYSKKPKYDLTCCVHAEWNAILDACKNNSDEIAGSTLYFMRINENGDLTDAGEPYCTTCSRLALQSGVGFFALWNAGMAEIYETGEYNKKSYDFYKT